MANNFWYFSYDNLICVYFLGWRIWYTSLLILLFWCFKILLEIGKILSCTTSVHVCVCVHVSHRVQKITFRNQFSLYISIMWIPEIELRLPELVESILPHWSPLVDQAWRNVDIVWLLVLYFKYIFSYLLPCFWRSTDIFLLINFSPSWFLRCIVLWYLV